MGKKIIKNDVCFKQNGTMEHYVLAVGEYLREVFSGCEFAVRHLCHPLHLNDNLNAQIRHHVIIE